MNKLVTIMTSSLPNDLSVPVSLLEDNGIKCFLQDEHLGQLLSTGVQLQVAQEDVEQAAEILVRGGFIPGK